MEQLISMGTKNDLFVMADDNNDSQSIGSGSIMTKILVLNYDRSFTNTIYSVFGYDKLPIDETTIDKNIVRVHDIMAPESTYLRLINAHINEYEVDTPLKFITEGVSNGTNIKNFLSVYDSNNVPDQTIIGVDAYELLVTDKQNYESWSVLNCLFGSDHLILRLKKLVDFLECKLRIYPMMILTQMEKITNFTEDEIKQYVSHIVGIPEHFIYFERRHIENEIDTNTKNSYITLIKTIQAQV